MTSKEDSDTNAITHTTQTSGRQQGEDALRAIAEQLGVSEEMALHMAVGRMYRDLFHPDDDEVDYPTDEQLRAIDRTAEFEAAGDDHEVDSLKETVVQLRRAVKTSQEEAESLGDFKGEDDAIDFLKDYLEEIHDNIDDTFRPLAEKFSNNFLANDDYQDAKKELRKLENWHQEERSEFLEDQQEMVEDFLED